ncbi:GntR family transcriptional regulator [Pseudochelatococcus sp. B33]
MTTNLLTNRNKDKALKYRIIYEKLASRLQAGEWLPGDRLPTEEDIAEAEGVSLGTVQRALRMLEQDNLVVRRHGSGTYAASFSPEPNEIVNFFFLEDEESPLPLYTKVIDLTLTSKNGPWKKFLDHDGKFVRVRRITSVNFEFVTYAELYARDSDFYGLLDIPIRQLEGPELYRTMFTTLHLPPTRFTYRVWTASTPKQISSLIEIAPEGLSLHWEILAYSHRDKPLFYQKVYIPPSKRKLKFEVSVRSVKTRGS